MRAPTLYERLLRNHVFANLTFVLVLSMGIATYTMLPREQDPTINFNWVQVTTIFPGASAEDVEKLVTDPVEDALGGVSDIRFTSSSSRDEVSSVLVRFDDISQAEFDRRLTDLRREIQSKTASVFPDEVMEPNILEITTANAFATATLVVTAQDRDENLRIQVRRVKRDVERMAGVDRVVTTGAQDPELQVRLIPERLEALGLSPMAVADTVRRSFADVAAGTVRVGEQAWLVRLLGKDSDPDYLARIPILTDVGEIPLEAVAEVRRARKEAARMVSYQGQPAVMMWVFKQPDTNILDLVERLHVYIDGVQPALDGAGAALVLIDDQTEITRSALDVMQNNALLGLALVLAVTWFFLGSRIAILISVGIPFTLAGTFWLLGNLGQTLNVTVLLGVVISLGMIVDDAVVVVEAMYYRMVRGSEVFTAAREAMREVFAPVTTSVLTTIAAFSPLMMMPGIVGKFMMLVPLVVTSALAISLLEAYWMLPSHVARFAGRMDRQSRLHAWRTRMLRWIRTHYTRLLVHVLRRPRRSLALVLLCMTATFATIPLGMLRIEFFAFDPIRLFYVNIEMPASTSLAKTLERTVQVEQAIRAGVRPGEVREMVSYAGLMMTETEPLFGDNWGQLLVSLNPSAPGLRSVDEMIEGLRDAANAIPGPLNVSFMRIAGGPPSQRPINVKVRGDDFDTIRAAVAEIMAYLETEPAVRDIAADDRAGSNELRVRLDFDALRRAGIDPSQVGRALRLATDGEVVANLQQGGERIDVRVLTGTESLDDIERVLQRSLPLPGGGSVTLDELTDHRTIAAPSNIRHYNFRRAITVEADLDKQIMDTPEANARLVAFWESIRARHPTIDLDFTGELDDIQESLDSIGVLFLFGLGLIYMILGTQFRSYFQPLMILSTVPMAFSGVVLGLLITNNPLSLFTLYGIVALGGIAVNAAIVLISAGNARIDAGMSVLHATLYAARRRVIPILITSLTTVAGLFSLATGLGGKSLLWGPVATAIVWGLVFSTVLTLLVVPLLFRLFMTRAVARRRALSG